MKHLKSFILIFIACGLLTSAYASKSKDRQITAEVLNTPLLPDSTGAIPVFVRYTVPEKFVPVRGRIFITPALTDADTVVREYEPLVLEGKIFTKKLLRREVLDHYIDPYQGNVIKVNDPGKSFEIENLFSADMPPSMISGKFITIVSKDGCGICSGLDTIPLASFDNLSSLVDLRDAATARLNPHFEVKPKIGEGKGVANLQFAVNNSAINLSMGNNKAELDSIVAALAPILSDSLATLTSLQIYGMASADGPLKLNTTLSSNRAAAARNWLVDRLSIPPHIQRLIKIGSRPEGWEPVLEAMIADGHPGAADMKAILDKYAGQSDDVAEKFIRKLPAWNDIKDRYLQKDRKVEYQYAYSIKSFTDDNELLNIYRTRPEICSEEELFRVTELQETPEDKMRAYETLLRFYPESEAGAVNLASIYMANGENALARQLLLHRSSPTPQMNVTIGASYLHDGDMERAEEILQSVDLPEARYNMGLIRLKQNRLSEAYNLLREFTDNQYAALAALATGHIEEAASIMEKCESDTPVARYVRSAIGTQSGKESIPTNIEE